MRNSEDPSAIVENMAGQLLAAVSTGDAVDADLIDYAEQVIQAHQVYVQLLYVGMVVEQITKLTMYFAAQDDLVEDLDLEAILESTPAEKIRAVSALNQAIKTKVEIIGSMMASKEAIGMLTASLKDTFGDGEVLLKEGGADNNFMEALKALDPEQRQRVLGTAVSQLRKTMINNALGEDNSDD